MKQRRAPTTSARVNDAKDRRLADSLSDWETAQAGASGEKGGVPDLLLV